MISINELEKTALARLDDAEWLIKGQRFDSAIYLCGYCLEMAFKVRLCKDANRTDFPESSLEFKLHDLKHWQSHSLTDLAKLCSIYGTIKKKHWQEWTLIQTTWAVEIRYKLSAKTKEEANDFINAIKVLLKVIL